MRGIERLLREALPGLTPAERRVAEYFLGHLDTLPDIAISDVAQASGVAKSAVVRLCKRLGMKGYKEFLQALRVDQSGGTGLDAKPFSGADSPQALCAQVAEAHMRALRDTLAGLDMNAVHRAAESLRGADYVEVYAGTADAEDCADRLRRMGLRAYAMPVPSERSPAPALPDADATLLLLCADGQAEGLLRLAEAAREAGAEVLTLAGREHAALLALSDAALPFAAGGRSARLPMLSLTDMLLTCIADLPGCGP